MKKSLNSKKTNGHSEGDFGNKQRHYRDDDEILSDDLPEDGDEDEIIVDDQFGANNKQRKNKRDEPSDEEDDEETPQQKKIRLAKQYLSELENAENRSGRRGGDDDDEEEDKEDDVHRSNIISARLKEDVLDKAGQLCRRIADDLICHVDNVYKVGDEEGEDVKLLKNGHRGPITCLVVSSDGQFVFTGGKDCCIVKWKLETGKRLLTIIGKL